jgi:transposase
LDACRSAGLRDRRRPHRDTHALAIVDVRSGGIVLEASVAASSGGYARALELAREHASGRRAFAIEGTGSFGAGLTRFLSGEDERVLEVGRLRRERRSGGKTDALDAARAARRVLAQTRPAEPRAGGERGALRSLMAAREGARSTRDALGFANSATCWSQHPSRYGASCDY